MNVHMCLRSQHNHGRGFQAREVLQTRRVARGRTTSMQHDNRIITHNPRPRCSSHPRIETYTRFYLSTVEWLGGHRGVWEKVNPFHTGNAPTQCLSKLAVLVNIRHLHANSSVKYLVPSLRIHSLSRQVDVVRRLRFTHDGASEAMSSPRLAHLVFLALHHQTPYFCPISTSNPAIADRGA